MAGTKAGGQAAAATNKARYGNDFYTKIGAKGGKLGTTGGFGAGDAGRELARRAGAIGGTISKRGPSNVKRAEIEPEDILVPEGMRAIRSVIPPHKTFFVFWRPKKEK